MTPLLDTHQHLIYPGKVGYTWTDDIPPLADQGFTVDDYAALTKGKGVGATIFMEAGVDDPDYMAETRMVAELASDRSNNIIGIIASCRPESDDGFDAWLDECSDLPVVGFRRILHVVDDDVSQSDTFRANVRKIGDRDRIFDMCFLARQLPIALELAKTCDNTSFVLNHCGVPDIAGGDLDQWCQGISELASLSHVACKVSGIMAYCAPGTASLETIRPVLDHVADRFGADRLVWGSDWPVVNLGGGIEGWIDASREFMNGMSEGDAAKLAHKNAKRIYGVSM